MWLGLIGTRSHWSIGNNPAAPVPTSIVASYHPYVKHYVAKTRLKARVSLWAWWPAWRAV